MKKLIGYGKLIEELTLNPTVPIVSHSLADSLADSKHQDDEEVKKIWSVPWSLTYDKLNIVDNLIYALQREDLNLFIMKSVFDIFTAKEENYLARLISSNVSNIYYRQLGYLYESMTGKSLDIKIEDASFYVKIHYSDLISQDNYYTSLKPTRNAKYKITDNLLGNMLLFSPIIKKTKDMLYYESLKLNEKYDNILGSTPDIEVRKRAIPWLYYNESKCSYEFESDANDKARIYRYMKTLKNDAEQWGGFNESTLVKIQNSIVDSRYTAESYRSDYQNYICGFADMDMTTKVIKYICPHPKYVKSLMDGVTEVYSKTVQKGCTEMSVPAACAVSGGFILTHPFKDGNGRTGRHIMHHILSETGYAPSNYVFPISQAIMKGKGEYIRSLSDITIPIMDNVDYDINYLSERENLISLEIKNPKAEPYRYPDLTGYTETVYSLLEKCIDRDIPELFERESKMVEAKKRICDIIPEMKISRGRESAYAFVESILRGRGKLSNRGDFAWVSWDQIKEAQDIVTEIVKVSSTNLFGSDYYSYPYADTTEDEDVAREVEKVCSDHSYNLMDDREIEELFYGGVS